MRVLLVKTSSLGDVVHALCAVTDAARALPGLRLDWLVEEGFAQLPGWHPAVEEVIPVAFRRWRKATPLGVAGLGLVKPWRAFKRDLAAREYDLVLDAQGLMKSAWLARLARGPKAGFDGDSARERLASWFYQRRCSVPKGQHAVARQRALFAAALGYDLPQMPADFGLRSFRDGLRSGQAEDSPYLLFLHGTTWPTKHYPEPFWRELLALAGEAGWRVRLPWGNEAERLRAGRLARLGDWVEVLPRLDLAGVARVVAGAAGVVSVDTGLSHLAAAFDVPQWVLYGSTDPGLTGALGEGQRCWASDLACAPCLQRDCAREARPAESSIEAWPPCFLPHSPQRVWLDVTRSLGSL